MSEILELFGYSARRREKRFWSKVVAGQQCPYLGRRCVKVRKSEPEIAIGTCAVNYGKLRKPVVICPYRFLERRQVFSDALHLLSLHEPGNELHVVPEITIPGGSVDYFLVSARDGKAIDFVGIELQTLDTTGTVWPARQEFLRSTGMRATTRRAAVSASFGMNWKMTAKTTLVQLHHKVETFEHLSKRLVLVLQDCLLAYMEGEFRFDHLGQPKLGDTVHIHAYAVQSTTDAVRLQLVKRCSTDAAGIARALGLQAEAKVALREILTRIQRKMSDKTLWTPV